MKQKPNGRLSFSADTQVWTIASTPDVIIRVKRIFPRLLQSRADVVTLKHTPEVAAELLWVLSRWPLECPDMRYLKRGAREFEFQQQRLEAIETGAVPAGVYELALPLRDYQRLGVDLYLAQRYLLLADVMGLGKTATAIASFCDQRTLPALLVCEPHVVIQHAKEIGRFLPQLRVHVIKTKNSYLLPDADVYICTYSKLAGWIEFLAANVRSMIFDEVQALRHTDTAKYKAAALIRENVDFCIGLSGTPVFGYGSDIWNIFQILAPDRLGSFEEFTREWCSGPDGRAQIKDPLALGHYLRNQRLMLRRTKAEVGRDLPPVTRYPHEIEIDHRAYAREFSRSSGVELAKRILSGQYLKRGQAARQFDLKLRQATGIAKAPYVADLVRMILEGDPDEIVLLSGWHRAVYDIWLERLKDFAPVMYTGTESPAKKAAAVDAFVSKASRVFIISNRSGSGLDGLQFACSTVVVGELDWAAAVIDQLVTRVDRDGQTKPVSVYVPLANIGSDPTMCSVLGIKRAISSGVVNLGEGEPGDIIDVSPARVIELAKDWLAQQSVKADELGAIELTA